MKAANPPGSSTASDRDYMATVVLVVLALALRLGLAFHFISEPVWDGHYYHFGAERLAQGLGYSEDVLKAGRWVWKPWTHYPVGYSFWLSLFYRVFGSHLWVAPFANAVVGAMTVFGIHRLAYASLGVWRGRVAGLLTALHPGLAVYTAVVMSEPLAAALMVLSLLAVVSVRRRAVGLVTAGLLLGASVLVRPSGLLALPLMLLVSGNHFKARVLGSAVIACVCFVTVLPWTYRNCRRMDGCALVSTNAGWNLAIGALTDTGRFRPLRAADGCPVVTGQVQQDRCWWDHGIRVILSDPVRWLRLAPAKLSQTFDHESFAVEYLREANPGAWPEVRRVAYRERLTLAHRVIFYLAGLSVIGFVWRRRPYLALGWYLQGLLLVLYLVGGYSLFFSEPHPFFWLALLLPGLALLPLPGRPSSNPVVAWSLAFLALTAITHVVFFGDDRYHLVVTPLLCLLAAAALRRDARFDAERGL